MTVWQPVAAERLMLYSPIGLHLIDDFTGQPPIGALRIMLDRQLASGEWEPSGIDAVRTPGDVIIYPGLGRSAHAATQPASHYRVRIEAPHYRADYLTTDAGIEFDADPYDDSTPPAAIPQMPQRIFLLPAPSYPFQTHVRLVRGVLRDASNQPVANAEVTEGINERVLSDERGGFALPLRWSPLSGAVQIDALDHRTGASGQISLTLPADLTGGHIITLN
jgi:hypothetical protein